jgi:phosphomannomutase
MRPVHVPVIVFIFFVVLALGSNANGEDAARGMIIDQRSSDWADREDPRTIVLFDVDGTLTPSRLRVTDEVLEVLRDLKRKTVIGFVGGSDLAKQIEQLGEDVVTSLFDFGFSENGLTAFRKGQLIGQESIIDFLGEERYQNLINWILRYFSDLQLPVKRGLFVELRKGMINVSPIGRQCSQSERLAFEAYDGEKKVRQTMVDSIKAQFTDYNLQFAIGGQISIDIFPIGWDKTFCLRHLAGEGFERIHFFGDRTAPGGNDNEIYSHESVIGHTVRSPEDTISQLREIFAL